MSKRLIIIPRMSGTPNSDWYPWLARHLETAEPGAFAPVMAAAMPNPRAPIIHDWVAQVAHVVGNDPQERANTLLIGHSVGCQAILRHLAAHDATPVFGVLLVAAWWSVDQSWDTLDPWIETPFDVERTCACMGRAVVVISDNDPFIADTLANKRLWQERLGAKVLIVSGAQHFNDPVQPGVLNALVEEFGSTSN